MEDGKQPLLCHMYDGNDQSNPENSLIPRYEPSSNSSSSKFEGEIGPINGIIDFSKEFIIESRKLWHLACPSIFNSVCQYGIGSLTQIFAGHLGTIQLAGISVENSVIAGFGYGILVYVLGNYG